MTSGSTLNVRYNAKHHVNIGFIGIILSSKSTRGILIGNIPHDCRAFSNLDITINEVRQVWEIKAKLFFHRKPA
jgi:hypothetical protein